MLPFSVETWPPRVSEGVFTARGGERVFLNEEQWNKGEIQRAGGGYLG